MNIYESGFNNLLTKNPLFVEPVHFVNNFSEGVAPQSIGSGDMATNTNLVDGYLQSSNFVTGSAGWRINADGDVEFNDGVFRGSLSASTIDIGGSDATSFHVDIDGNMWLGAAAFASAPFKVTNAGAVTVGTDAWHVDTSGNMWWGSAASYAAATIKISAAGSIDFTTGTFSGTLSAAGGTLGTITAGTITGGTITGTTIKATSATTGANVFVDPTNRRIAFLYDNVEKGYVFVNSLGQIFVDGDDMVVLQADGTGDDILIQADNIVKLLTLGNGQIQLHATSSGSSVSVQATSYFEIGQADAVDIFFNSDNDNSDCHWVDAGSAPDDTLMRLDVSDESLYIDGLFIDTGADFAEFFEATEEFSKEKIPSGTSVILVGDKIRPAKQEEVPFGVISATPTIVGNSGGVSTDEEWGGKYLKDKFGQYIMEEAEFWSIRKVNEEKPVRKFKKRKLKADRPEKQVKGSERMEVFSGFSDRVPAPENAEKKLVMRKKLNPDWRSDEVYIPRSKRPEWNIVGLVGRLRILKGQPVAPHWIKMKDISENIEEWLIR